MVNGWLLDGSMVNAGRLVVNNTSIDVSLTIFWFIECEWLIMLSQPGIMMAKNG